jgi:hypothetical protein
MEFTFTDTERRLAQRQMDVFVEVAAQAQRTGRELLRQLEG